MFITYIPYMLFKVNLFKNKLFNNGVKIFTFKKKTLLLTTIPEKYIF